MLGAIPNPKKTISIDFEIKKVKKAVTAISVINNKYKISNSNEILNTYTFDALEFLSLGVFIDISLNQITENKTEITIEVRRKVGSFDQSHEITNANKHIQKILENISTGLTMGPDQIDKIKGEMQKKSSKGCLGSAILIFLVFIFITSFILLH